MTPDSDLQKPSEEPSSEKQPPEKPSVADRFAEIAIRALRPGGVTVGGIGAFWILFQESDILKAKFF